ncbi:MAG: hypothetical protein IPM64_02435 [Phycisphaerales bacterium]|nr:hypothetical protein [Phycisphaerales bacterium]
MTQKRVWAAAGSMAAAIALAFAGLSIFGTTGRVHAGMILQNFRESLSRGFSVRFENVVTEGARLDGELVIAFAAPAEDAPVESSDGGSTSPCDLPIESMFIDARAVGVEGGELEGLDAEFRLVTGFGDDWLFVRANGLPDSWTDENPLSGIFGGALENGVLIELDHAAATMEGCEGSELIISAGGASAGNIGFGRTMTTGGSAVVQASVNGREVESLDELDPAIRRLVEQAMKDGTGTVVKTTINGREVESLDELDPAIRRLVEQAMKDGGAGESPSTEELRQLAKSAPGSERGGVFIAIGAHGGDAGGTAPAVVGIHAGSTLPAGADGEVGRLLGDVLAGRADAERVHKLLSLLNASAEGAEVEEPAPGEYVLTIRNITAANLMEGFGPADQPVILRLAHSAAGEVHWAEVSGVGSANGRIRFQRHPGEIAPQQLDRAAKIEKGRTLIIGTDGLMPLIGGAGRGLSQ